MICLFIFVLSVIELKYQQKYIYFQTKTKKGKYFNHIRDIYYRIRDMKITIYYVEMIIVNHKIIHHYIRNIYL